jgi:hypothetical protein
MAELSPELETLRLMINADISEANSRGGVSLAEWLTLLAAMTEQCLSQMPRAERERYWPRWVKHIEDKMRRMT